MANTVRNRCLPYDCCSSQAGINGYGDVPRQLKATNGIVSFYAVSFGLCVCVCVCVLFLGFWVLGGTLGFWGFEFFLGGVGILMSSFVSF